MLPIVKVHISPLFFALLAWLMIYEQQSLAAGCLAASLIHECGHLLVLLTVKAPPQKICVGLFGMRIERAERPTLSFAQDIAIAAGGPLANAFSALLFYVLHRFDAMWIHLLMGGLNLLPVEALDGGQILLNVLYRFTSKKTAETIVWICSLCVLLPLGAAGCWLLLYSRGNISLLAVDGYLLLLLFFRRKH